MTDAVPEISVVLPVYNEAPVLDELLLRIHRALEGAVRSFEIVVVDDGSYDGTWQRLTQLLPQYPALRAFRLSRNFGLQPAISVGLREARGEAVILMDADLQDPPELLGTLVQRWREGYEVVYTTKISRREGPIKRLWFWLFYELLDWLSEPKMPRQSGLFSLMARPVVDAINEMPEQAKYFPGLRTWVGFRQVAVPYRRQARYDQKPRQDFFRLLRMAGDAILSFSAKPLFLLGSLGILLLLVSLNAGIVIISLRVFTNLAIPGWASTITLLLFSLGMNAFFLGILGLYLGQILQEVKGRPPAIVRERLSAGPAAPSPGEREDPSAQGPEERC